MFGSSEVQMAQLHVEFVYDQRCWCDRSRTHWVYHGPWRNWKASQLCLLLIFCNEDDPHIRNDVECSETYWKPRIVSRDEQAHVCANFQFLVNTAKTFKEACETASVLIKKAYQKVWTPEQDSVLEACNSGERFKWNRIRTQRSVACFLDAQRTSGAYNPMIMRLQASGINFTADVLNTKIILILDVKWLLETSIAGEGALHTKSKSKHSKIEKKNRVCSNCIKPGRYASWFPSTQA